MVFIVGILVWVREEVFQYLHKNPPQAHSLIVPFTYLTHHTITQGNTSHTTFPTWERDINCASLNHCETSRNGLRYVVSAWGEITQPVADLVTGVFLEFAGPIRTHSYNVVYVLLWCYAIPPSRKYISSITSPPTCCRDYHAPSMINCLLHFHFPRHQNWLLVSWLLYHLYHLMD